MRVMVLGGSGFIGTAIVRVLRAGGHDVVVSTRSAQRPAVQAGPQGGALSFVRWDGSKAEALASILDEQDEQGGVDAVVNLLGENLAARRWSAAQKQTLLQSRLGACQGLCQALEQRTAAGHALPECLVQASACGYYGLWEDMDSAPLCTEDRVAGEGFLAHICVAWEDATQKAQDLGLRCCLMRLAPVLGNGGGFLHKMLPSFRWGLGGAPGSGRQPLSWVYMEDVARAVLHMLEHTNLSGPCNVCSPQPVSMNTLAASLGKALHRPAFLHAPAFALRLALGEMADEMLLAGQAAIPARLQASGFDFLYADLDAALPMALATQHFGEAIRCSMRN